MFLWGATGEVAWFSDVPDHSRPLSLEGSERAVSDLDRLRNRLLGGRGGEGEDRRYPVNAVVPQLVAEIFFPSLELTATTQAPFQLSHTKSSPFICSGRVEQEHWICKKTTCPYCNLDIHREWGLPHETFSLAWNFSNTSSSCSTIPEQIRNSTARNLCKISSFSLLFFPTIRSHVVLSVLALTRGQCFGPTMLWKP